MAFTRQEIRDAQAEDVKREKLPLQSKVFEKAQMQAPRDRPWMDSREERSRLMSLLCKGLCKAEVPVMTYPLDFPSSLYVKSVQ